LEREVWTEGLRLVVKRTGPLVSDVSLDPKKARFPDPRRQEQKYQRSMAIYQKLETSDQRRIDARG